VSRILVVDDDVGVRQALADVLDFAGYDVETAANGAEALERVRRHAPDAVFLDLMMPVMDGWSFLEAYRREVAGATTPVALISAVPDVPKLARELGARTWIAKPFDLDDVLAAAEQLV
jgi:CheY-like chemotaxis protein